MHLVLITIPPMEELVSSVLITISPVELLVYYSVNYHLTGGVFSVLSITYHPPNGVISIEKKISIPSVENYFLSVASAPTEYAAVNFNLLKGGAAHTISLVFC